MIDGDASETAAGPSSSSSTRVSPLDKDSSVGKTIRTTIPNSGWKPRRKPGVACDLCRNRRVRCDITERHEGTGCSRCQRQGVVCTDKFIQSKRSKRRSGKRIEKAKELHGTRTSDDSLIESALVDERTPVIRSTDSFRSFISSRVHPSPATAYPLSATPHNNTFAVDHRLPVSFTPQYSTSHCPNYEARALPTLHPTTPVRTRLANAVLSEDVSSHLISSFFSASNQHLFIINEPAFVSRLRECDNDPSKMSPAEVVICAAMQAWGARTSALAIVLGDGSDDSSNGGGTDSRYGKRKRGDGAAGKNEAIHIGARVVQATSVTFVNAADADSEGDLSSFGAAREAFCQQLLDRALKMMDERGLMRDPSIEGVQALLLLGRLVNYCSRRYRQGRLIMTVAFEQIRLLQLTHLVTYNTSSDESALNSVYRTGATPTRVFWVGWITDAMSSVAMRTRPTFEEDRIVSLDDDLPNTFSLAHCGEQSGASLSLLPYPLTNFSPQQSVSFLVLAYVQLGVLARHVSAKIIAGVPWPSLDPSWVDPNVAAATSDDGRFVYAGGCTDLDEYDGRCRESWRRALDMWTAFEACVSKGEQAWETYQGFSPLIWIASVKIGLMDLVIYSHWAIHDLYQSAQRVAREKSRQVSDHWSPSSAKNGQDLEAARVRVDRLRELYDESSRMVLLFCRRIAQYFRTLLPTGVIKFGGENIKHICLAGNFLSVAPTIDSHALKADPASAGSPPPKLHDWLHHGYKSACPDARFVAGGGEAVEGWTWDTKLAEVGWCLGALGQLGWTWDRVKEDMATIRQQMKYTAPEWWDGSGLGTSPEPEERLVDVPTGAGSSSYMNAPQGQAALDAQVGETPVVPSDPTPRHSHPGLLGGYGTRDRSRTYPAISTPLHPLSTSPCDYHPNIALPTQGDFIPPGAEAAPAGPTNAYGGMHGPASQPLAQSAMNNDPFLSSSAGSSASGVSYYHPASGSGMPGGGASYSSAPSYGAPYGHPWQQLPRISDDVVLPPSMSAGRRPDLQVEPGSHGQAAAGYGHVPPSSSDFVAPPSMTTTHPGHPHHAVLEDEAGRGHASLAFHHHDQQQHQHQQHQHQQHQQALQMTTGHPNFSSAYGPHGHG